MKHADQEELVPILTTITRDCFKTGKLPDIFKVGLITPVPKKDKNASHPDKFRRITVSSLPGKIVETRMTELSNVPLNTYQSKHQFGFTVKCSPSNAAMLIVVDVT